MNIFILTGAGLSAESGLGTFRDKGDGFWTRFDPMKLATPGLSRAIPAKFMPSTICAARTCLRLNRTKRIERWPVSKQGWSGRGNLFLVTQNIDDLHERAVATRHSTCMASF